MSKSDTWTASVTAGAKVNAQAAGRVTTFAPLDTCAVSATVAKGPAPVAQLSGVVISAAVLE